MKKEARYKFGKISWSELNRFLARIGWELTVNKADLKRYAMGDKALALARVGMGAWKVEYFVSNRLIDSGGVADEEFAKVVVVEMAALRGLKA